MLSSSSKLTSSGILWSLDWDTIQPRVNLKLKYQLGKYTYALVCCYDGSFNFTPRVLVGIFYSLGISFSGPLKRKCHLHLLLVGADTRLLLLICVSLSIHTNRFELNTLLTNCRFYQYIFPYVFFLHFSVLLNVHDISQFASLLLFSPLFLPFKA